jgi:hypothetical protein
MPAALLQQAFHSRLTDDITLSLVIAVWLLRAVRQRRHLH